MRKIYSFFAFAMMTAMLFSYNKEGSLTIIPNQGDEQIQVVATKAYGSTTPKIAVYVETNGKNPLKAGDYYRADGSTFVDIVELFAANLNKETVSGSVASGYTITIDDVE